MTQHSFLFQREPRWRVQRQGLRQQFSPAIQSWLYETGSLTRRLRAQYGNQVAVKVLMHDWYSPYLSERRLLVLPDKRLALVREVLLHVGQTPLILARTIMPLKTVQIANSRLLHLGNRPIGEVLFAYRHLKSELRHITEIPFDLWQDNVRDLAKINQPIIGRRVVHQFMGQELIICEFFLQELVGARQSHLQ
jgi:chorismate--pyruvate lyase